MLNEVERIVDQLEREHAGEPWHGTALAAVLQRVTAEQAARRPLAGGHSIWEIVLHMTAWKNEVRHRLSGALAGEPREGDWPPVGEPMHLGVGMAPERPEPNLFQRLFGG